MQTIIPCLWFDNQAEEAVNFYIALFPNSKIKTIARYDEEGAQIAGKPKGSVMTVTFELKGEEFMALNGGPVFSFSPAISFMVNCDTQGEIDHFWDRLSEGGEQQQCGWLKDKFGVTWQIVPTALGELMRQGDAVKSRRMMHALLQMKKLDIAALKEAYNGEPNQEQTTD